jgi:hypothetical protein
MEVHRGASASVVIFANWFVTWWNSANSMTLIRFLLSFGAAGFTIWGLNRTLFKPAPVSAPADEGKDPVRFAVALNATVFVTLGLATAATAAANWETALLVAGSSLLAGGFIGLLFGVPQKQSTQEAKSDAAVAGKQRDNLVVESAATLGKVLTGFTLAEVGPIYQHFLEIARAISHHLSSPPVPPNAVLAGAILIYFFATGFLSGLFLPNYFMKDYR